MKKQNEILKLSNQIQAKIKKEKLDISVEDFVSKIKNISFSNKYALWCVQKYIENGIQRYEDMGRVETALSYFHKYKNHLEEKDRNIMNIKSLVGLENLVEPFAKFNKQKELEKINKEKVYSETQILYDGPEGKILIPLSVESSKFWGQGTKWCTASVGGNNYFEHYNKQGNIYIFILPEKDENGREIKYQLHFESNQFMDMKDIQVDLKENKNENLKLILKIFANLDIYFDDCKNKSFLKIKDEVVFGTKEYLSLLHHAKKIIDTDKFLDFFPFLYEYKENKTVDFTILFSTKQIFANYMYCVPDEHHKYISPSNILMAVRKKPDNLFLLPASILDISHVLECLKYNPEIWTSKKEKIMNMIEKLGLDFENFCENAIDYGVKFLQFVPEKYMNSDLVEKAVSNYICEIEYVPSNFITKTMVDEALDRIDILEKFLYKIPKKFKTRQNYMKLHVRTYDYRCAGKVKGREKMSEIIKLFPIEYQNSDFFTDIAKTYDVSLKSIPLQYITKEICDILFNKNINNFIDMPDKFKTEDMVKTIMKTKLRAYYTQYIPENMMPDELKSHHMLETKLKTAVGRLFC